MKSFKNNNLFKIVVNSDWKLLDFLFSRISNFPKCKIKSMLRHKQILVNGFPITQFDYSLNKGDEVLAIKKSYKEDNFSDKKLPFDILYEDEDFIVVNKPSSLLSVSSDKETKKTVYYFLNQYVSNKNRKKRIYIVHRLDEGASGVLFFVKNFSLKNAFQKNWNNLVKKRNYYVVVDGKMAKKEDLLVNFLKKNKLNLVYVTDDKFNGKKAITHYKVIKENKKFSLLDVSIKTGRQNQIRVQLGNIGHYVLGDNKYGKPKNPIHRLALHAYLLEFIHPFTKKKFCFKSPIPKIFSKLF
ncbi:RluA family pseudouridine synthase [bacterium]|nr:RluA family pseudouridine synthase [bacterium]